MTTDDSAHSDDGPAQAGPLAATSHSTPIRDRPVASKPVPINHRLKHLTLPSRALTKLVLISPTLTGLIILICLPEIILLLADYGVIGSPRWRLLAYQYGAFWAGLLHGWQPNYRGQFAVMFVSYGFLHTGPGHLIGNMLALGWLGARIIARWRAARFCGLYLASLLGGAAGFGLLSQNPAPMIGASGAVFGLAGAWMVGEWQDRRAKEGKLGQRRWLALWSALWPALSLVLVLAGFNLISWILQNGQLAWETHLGGFLAGLIAALCLRKRQTVAAKIN